MAPKKNKSSLESALEEERRDVVAILEGRASSQPPRPSSKVRTPSPAGTAQSPVRSMLDLSSTPGARRASIANGMGSPTSPKFGESNVRSMLNTSSPSPAPLSASRTNHSPTSPSSVKSSGSPRTDPESAYKFEMLPTIEAHSMPKRVSQGGKLGIEKSKGALASVFGSRSSKGRHNSTAGILDSGRPASPSSRINRSESPGGLTINKMNFQHDPKKYVSDNGKTIDMNNAYRRLSDAQLLRSGGSLSKLPTRKGSDPIKGESTAPDGGVRLQEDFDPDAEEAINSSDDAGSEGDTEDERSIDKRRGRDRTRRHPSNQSEESPALSDEEANRGPKSLLAAAEEERQ